MPELKKKIKTPWELRIEARKKEPIRYYWAFPPQSFHSRHVDDTKSRPYIAPSGQLENRNALPFWKPLNRPLAGLDEYLHELGKLKLDEFTVNCNVCGLELVTYFVEKNTKGSEDGILGLKYTQHLMAYRPREDGLLGLECVCGMSDTRLSTQEKLKYPTKFPALTPSTSADVAKFNGQAQPFSATLAKSSILERGKEVR